MAKRVVIGIVTTLGLLLSGVTDANAVNTPNAPASVAASSASDPNTASSAGKA